MATIDSAIVNMRIVDEVSNYGWNALSGPDSHSANIKAKVDPSPMSGPAHLAVLANKCFSYTANNYKYDFCPFHNVTQHEQSMRWSPYSGILGVWNEWKIENNSFVSMVMKNGDSCGNSDRQVEIYFACASKHNVTSVTEPTRCHYNLTFETPLVCHKDSMLVYPVINTTLQKEWDLIEQDYHDKLLTEKGYKKLLNDLFYKAGFLSENESSRLVQLTSNAFSSLETCNVEYEELQKEVKRLSNLVKGIGRT